MLQTSLPLAPRARNLRHAPHQRQLHQTSFAMSRRTAIIDVLRILRRAARTCRNSFRCLPPYFVRRILDTSPRLSTVPSCLDHCLLSHVYAARTRHVLRPVPSSGCNVHCLRTSLTSATVGQHYRQVHGRRFLSHNLRSTAPLTFSILP